MLTTFTNQQWHGWRIPAPSRNWAYDVKQLLCMIYVIYARVNTKVGWTISPVPIFFAYFQCYSLLLNLNIMLYSSTEFHLCSRSYGMIAANPICSILHQPVCVSIIFKQVQSIIGLIYKIFMSLLHKIAWISYMIGVYMEWNQNCTHACIMSEIHTFAFAILIWSYFYCYR